MVRKTLGAILLYVAAGALLVGVIALISVGASPTLHLGSYNGAANYAGDAAFGQETNTTVTVYSDYLDSSNECSGNPFPLGQINKPWNVQLELSVPIPGFQLGVNGQQLLAQNAANPAAWDACFANLGNALVADGFPGTMIRLMWEPDSGIYSNDDLTSAANYATLWRDAWNSMQVPGQHFQWAWYWAAGFDANTNQTAYPGPTYVNYITFDQYDQSWTGACGLAYNGSSWTPAQSQCVWDNDISHNLAGLVSFAAAHDRGIGIGEWGVINRSDGHGGGDDPTFVNNMSSWLLTHANWESYFNFNSGGDSVLSDFPNSLAAFKADL